MSRILFENSKFALGFAAVTLVGAGVLMGTDNSLSGVELEADSEPAQSQRVVAQTQPVAQTALPKDQPIIADWASDEELIDTAEGFNTSPVEPVEIVDSPATGANSGVPSGQSTTRERSAGSASPRPNVSDGAGPPPAMPKAAQRSGALDVK